MPDEDNQSLRTENTRLRIRLIEMRRERDHAMGALKFYADKETWMMKPDHRGGYRASEAMEDHGMLARSILMGENDAKSQATKNRAMRELPFDWRPVQEVPGEAAAGAGAAGQPKPEEQVQRPEV